MPRGKPKKQVLEKEQLTEEKTDSTEIIKNLTETIKDLKNEIETLKVQLKENVEKKEELNDETVSSTIISEKDKTSGIHTTGASNYPVPMEYRMLVNQELGEDFGIEIEPSTDLPAFEFTIIVPEKYSNIPQEEKEEKRVDRRSKMITYAEGINGVRQWVWAVKKNLASTKSEQIK